MSALDDYLNSLHAMTEKLLNPMVTGNSQQQWEDKPRMGGNQFLASTGRIFAGGTGDIANRDEMGNITGYTARNRGSLTPGLDRQKRMQMEAKAWMPLSTASGTPGLDAFHAMNPQLRTKPSMVTKPAIGPPVTGQDVSGFVNRLFT